MINLNLSEEERRIVKHYLSKAHKEEKEYLDSLMRESAPLRLPVQEVVARRVDVLYALLRRLGE